MPKQIIYYLNGKESNKKDITKRKAKLSKEDFITYKYFDAPLTKEEKEQKNKEAQNASKYFQDQRDYRADLEMRHG